MRPATRALVVKHGWRFDRAAHNYIYFAFYRPYVRVLTFFVDRVSPHLERFTFLTPAIRFVIDRYHAKMLSGENAAKILELDEDLSAVSERNRAIVPFDHAHKILLEDPEFIAVMDCPCKRASGVSDPELLNSCICVGRKTAEFWIDRSGGKYRARRITQGEALDMVRGFRRRGYVTQAFFKVATGGSTGVICNCNLQTCGALRAHMILKSWERPGLRLVAESGYSVEHDAGRCDDCGACVRICQFGAVESSGGKRTGYVRGDCLGCGLCVEHCSRGALKLYRDPEKPVPLDLDIVREEYVTG